ncbi:hypothetical protein CVS54_01379 [Microbacterium oxydans]|uniref:Lipoprotein n=1 Tax=Microbacterium oxydans TaxID=82380 RepID=A0A3S9WJL0_9MICO|nr:MULTISPECIES: hypothetical protein [Microbacterium]AZS40057.1 hypothetical protein CVS54_01379 [Microbacterium oxydans]
MNISPARWTRRAWIAAFTMPLALSLALTACAPTTPTLEDAGKRCIEWQQETLGIDVEGADTMCEADYDRMGERRFIELYTGELP